MPEPEIITMAHGSGGEAMRRLLTDEIAVLYGDDAQWDDAAIVEAGARIAVTTDSFTVSPLIFPGGDIGELAAAGTINDLAVRGATPRYMTVGLIAEEGLSLDTLRTVLASLKGTCDRAGVRIITGDTKVVERGSGDGLFINTTGIGSIEIDDPPGSDKALPGDRVLVTGSLGDHGIAILAAREDLPMTASIQSDCAALDGLARAMLDAAGADIHVMRDPTRGGLAAALNEIAEDSGVDMMIREESLPVQAQVRGVCELLGFDPLHLPNEGKLVALVAAEAAERVLDVARRHPLGNRSALIGEVIEGRRHRVTVRTHLGTTRILAMPTGELLPRIC